MEGEKVVVRELDSGGRISSGRVIDSWIVVPSLAGALEVVLETTPLVPLESAVSEDEEDDGSDDDDRPNLCQLDKVTTEIVNHRSVDLITESDGGLLRNGEDGRLERDIVERFCDLLLRQFKGSVEARGSIRKTTFIGKRVETYRALSLSLIWAGEGMELLRLINAWVKLSGIVTFWRLSREGTENWGAVMSANGLILLIPLTAV